MVSSRKHTLFVIILTSCTWSKTATCYTLPPELPYYIHNTSGAILADSENVKVVNQKLFIIGGSPQGLLAYCVLSWEDALGAYAIDLCIQDLKTDKITSDVSAEIPEGNQKPFAYFWSSQKEKIKHELKKAHIQQENVTLSQFPFIHSGDTIMVKVSDSCSQEEYCSFQYAAFTAIEAVSSVHGKKTVMKESGVYFCDAVAIHGYVKLPFQSQIAIIMSSTGPGHECIPTRTRIKIVGCTITTGFKR